MVGYIRNKSRLKDEIFIIIFIIKSLLEVHNKLRGVAIYINSITNYQHAMFNIGLLYFIFNMYYFFLFLVYSGICY